MRETLQIVPAQLAESAPVAAVQNGVPHTAIVDRVRRQQAALLEIMKSGLLAQDLQAVCEKLTEITALTMSVARVSIWRLAKDGTSLDLADLYEATPGSHVAGLSLHAARYPAYFAALKANRVISAVDARLDPRTDEFCVDYLQPLRIFSMLDATIWQAGESYGVVCIESVDERRAWTLDEQQFAGSIADLVMLASENEARRTAQSRLADSEARFSQIFRLSPDWMVLTRLDDGVVLEVNASFERQSGYAAAEVIGLTTREIGLWAVAGQREQWLARNEAEGGVRGMEAEFRLKSGDIRTFEISSECTTVNGMDCLISISRDITEHKRHERMVFDIAQGVAATTGENFFRSLVERLLLALNADLAFVGELPIGDLTQVRTIAVQQATGPGENFSYQLEGSPCQQILHHGVCAYPNDVANLFPRDKPLTDRGIQGYVGAPLLDSRGRAMGLIAVLFKRQLDDFELAVQLLLIFAARASAELERRDQLAELEFRASHDQLTGLLNRAALEQEIDQAIQRAADGVHRALLLIDLDRFKEINDTLGHSIGDTLLVKIARRLADENAAGTWHHGRVARLGGDEFAIWVDNIESPQMAERLAAQTLSAIMVPFDLEGYRIEVGASIGVSLHPLHGKSASDLLRCADIAMYVAKRQGSGHALYLASEDPYTPQRLGLMSQLGDAVRGGELELHYQPRLNLAHLTTSGFEALVRWRHPQLGLLPPSQFIPLAELSDVIRPLTMWVIDCALTQLAGWHRAGRMVFMAINISARHLMDDSFPGQLRTLLEQHRINPALLELELTESAIMTDPERATKILRRIHDMGVHIAIDDFGTGYSSLSHLKRLPLNALKIDVSFVRHMLTNQQDAVIVESTIGLAHNLGLTVVAEGVEDAAILARLKALGCNEGQGYFIARPMDGDAATAWLETQCDQSNTGKS